MKQGIGVFIVLFFLGLMVQSASAIGIAGIQLNGNVDATGYSVTADSFIGSFSGSGAGLTSIQGANIADKTISTTSIADGAITPVKIGFYSRVAIVAPSGGDYTDPAAAMTAYTVWCNNPALDSTHPCLLKIMPGVYTVTSPVVMRPYIDIEGSGEKITKITGAISDIGFPPTKGTLVGASNAELRFLTVANTGTGSFTPAILNFTSSPSMIHVTATALGGTYNYGVYNSSSSPTMTNVSVTASGGTYNYGVYNYPSSGTVTINHSVIIGSTNTINNGSGVTTHVGNTQLAGGAASSTVTCAGVYDVNYVFYANTCP